MRSDDEVLVTAALENRECFAEIYDRYADRIFRFAWARTGSEQEANDVVGDTMVAALASLSSFDPMKGTLAGWLFGIASHRVADRQRKRFRFLQLLRSRPPSTYSDDALDTTLQHEDHEQVRSAVAKLPDHYRDVVILRFVGELSFAEVGSVLGISPGAAKMRLHRALEKLAVEVGESNAE